MLLEGIDRFVLLFLLFCNIMLGTFNLSFVLHYFICMILTFYVV